MNVKLDFESIEFATNPDATLAPLRKLNGLYSYELPDGAKAWLVVRRKDVEEVLTNGNIFKVSPSDGQQSYENNPFSKSIPEPFHLLASDGEEHRRLRAPLERFFTHKVLESYRVYVIEEVKNTLSKLAKNKIYDLAKEFSYLIPVKIISKMLGLSWDSRFPTFAISLQMVKSQPEEHLENVIIFHKIIRETIKFKSKISNGEDIISVMLQAGLAESEVLSMSLLLFIAGSGTTASLIIQGLRSIISNKNRPSNQLVDEILFCTSPANSAFPRYVHQDYILDGTPLQKGDLLIVLLQSANYDLKHGEDPLKSYLSFSKGIHHCIGWYIAKMQAEIAFDEFYKAFPNSEVTHEEWFSNIVSRDLVTLKVRLN